MKLGLKFGDNAANIAGHRVPYSLLGALAAILGAFLIWKFNQNGGINLGQQSPDLSGLGAGSDLGSFGDLGNLVNTLPSAPTYPAPSLGVPLPRYSYAYTATPSMTATPVNFSPPHIPTPTDQSGGGGGAANILGALGQLLRTPQAPPAPPRFDQTHSAGERASSVSAGGGVGGILGKVDPRAAAKVVAGGGGSFAN